MLALLQQLSPHQRHPQLSASVRPQNSTASPKGASCPASSRRVTSVHALASHPRLGFLPGHQARARPVSALSTTFVLRKGVPALVGSL